MGVDWWFVFNVGCLVFLLTQLVQNLHRDGVRRVFSPYNVFIWGGILALCYVVHSWLVLIPTMFTIGALEAVYKGREKKRDPWE